MPDNDDHSTSCNTQSANEAPCPCSKHLILIYELAHERAMLCTKCGAIYKEPC